jgi:protein-S-isoprenylcysteine O-methyltransferase Ste14
MFFTYYFAARFEEKKFLESDLKNSYQKYQTQTGMFFPRIVKRQE